MTLAGLLRIATVTVPVGLGCGGALAQQIVTVPPGVVIVMVPAPGTAPQIVASVQPVRPNALPPASIDELIANQESMMDRMMASIDSLFSRDTTDPVTAIDALMQRMGPGTVPAAAGGFCEESMSVSFTGGGKPPVVHVSRTGNGCSPAAAPVAAPPPTSPSPGQPKVMEIGDPPAVTGPPPVRHRT